ncbi:B2 bradykinin receptor-like [Menidia menidia]
MSLSPSSAEDQVLNTTNSSSCDFPQWTYIGIPVYIMVIAVMGIILNVFVLMVFCLHQKPCTVAEIYLSNLAAADLLLVSCLPFWAVNIINKFNWLLGELLCKIVNAGLRMNVFCSIYFLVLVSVDRYVALVHPLSYERVRRPLFAKVGSFLVWAFGLLLSTPTLLFRKTTFVPGKNITECYIDHLDNFFNRLRPDLMMLLFGFIIPVPIISFCTIKILKALGKRLTEGVNAKKTDNKATTLVLAVLVAFLICWLPFHLTKIPELLKKIGLLTGCSSIRILSTCSQIFLYLAFFNSVLNPILYVIVGKNFQEKVRVIPNQWRHNKRTTYRLNSKCTHLSKVVDTTI